MCVCVCVCVDGVDVQWQVQPVTAATVSAAAEEIQSAIPSQYTHTHTHSFTTLKRVCVCVCVCVCVSTWLVSVEQVSSWEMLRLTFSSVCSVHLIFRIFSWHKRHYKPLPVRVCCTSWQLDCLPVNFKVYLTHAVGTCCVTTATFEHRMSPAGTKFSSGVLLLHESRRKQLESCDVWWYKIVY